MESSRSLWDRLISANWNRGLSPILSVKANIPIKELMRLIAEHRQGSDPTAEAILIPVLTAAWKEYLPDVDTGWGICGTDIRVDYDRDTRNEVAVLIIVLEEDEDGMANVNGPIAIKVYHAPMRPIQSPHHGWTLGTIEDAVSLAVEEAISLIAEEATK